MEDRIKFQLIERDKIDSIKGLLESINKIKCENVSTQFWYRGHSDAEVQSGVQIVPPHQSGFPIPPLDKLHRVGFAMLHPPYFSGICKEVYFSAKRYNRKATRRVARL